MFAYGKEWRVKPPHLSAVLPALSVDFGPAPAPPLIVDLEQEKEPAGASIFSPMTWGEMPPQSMAVRFEQVTLLTASCRVAGVW